MIFRKKEEYSILVYVGNSKVSASFVSFSKGVNPRILFSVETFFPVKEKVDDLSLSDTMYSVLNEAILGLLKTNTNQKINKKIDSVFISLASPWFVSRMKDIHIEEQKYFIITKDFLRNILDVEEKKFEKDLNNSSYEDNFGKKLKVVENTFTNTKINGYSVSENINKKTNIFDVSLFTSITSENLLRNIFSLIEKHIHVAENKIHINTFPLVSFYSTQEVSSSVNSFIFMDITGEMTDITLVHDGGVSKNISFPSGRNFIIRQIAKGFNVSFEIADSLLHLYNSKKADEEIVKKMELIISEIENEWSIYFEDSLRHLSANLILPPTLYIFCGSDISLLYKKFLKTPKSDSTAEFRKKLNIIQIDNEKLSKFCTYEPKTKNDKYIAMMSIFYNKIKLAF